METREATIDLVEASSPVHERKYDPRLERDIPAAGIALCLSGGGYRAMLFHLGALWRLNELGYLPRLRQVSSVSGGSITAGVLGLHWNSLTFNNGVASNFTTEIARPIREFATKTIDVRSILAGFILPGGIAGRIAKEYRKHLFGEATLQNLPDAPLFVINAANLQSGALWRFSKPFMADYRVGLVGRPDIALASAVAASSAFPPFLSPLRLKVKPGDYQPVPEDEKDVTDLHRPPFTTRPTLTDGGVYDNLGLETAWKNWDTILISDGGQKMQPVKRPWGLWPLQTLRVLSVIDNQVRSRRKDQAIRSFKLRQTLRQSGEDENSQLFRLTTRKGAYWHMADDLGRYAVPGKLPCPLPRTTELARVRTRLSGLDDELVNRLINWGYAACDAHMRLWVDKNLPAPSGFPYPGGV